MRYMSACFFLEVISDLDVFLLEIAHISILRIEFILHLFDLLVILVFAALELSLLFD